MIRIPITKTAERPPDYALLIAYIQSLPIGDYTATIVARKRMRTHPQNAYLWGVVYPAVLYGLRDVGWELTSTEQAHEFCKQKFASREVINKDTGEVLTLPASTAAMNTTDFQAYVQQIREFAAEYLNIEIPEPNE